MGASGNALVFPLGAVMQGLVRSKSFNAGPPNAQEENRKLVITLIVAILLVGMAVWLATECNTAVDYILAVFFPMNYIMIRLLAPCR